MSAIETARLLLRGWEEDDLERLVALYGDPRVARFLSVDRQPWPRARSVGAFEHFRRQWQEYGFGALGGDRPAHRPLAGSDRAE